MCFSPLFRLIKYDLCKRRKDTSRPLGVRGRKKAGFGRVGFGFYGLGDLQRQ